MEQEELLKRAAEIRDEVLESANTAVRIGRLFVDLIAALAARPEAVDFSFRSTENAVELVITSPGREPFIIPFPVAGEKGGLVPPVLLKSIQKGIDDLTLAQESNRVLIRDLGQADMGLLERIQGINKESDPTTDPFQLLGRVTTAEEVNKLLDGLHSTAPADKKCGSFRILLGDSPFFVENFVLYYAGDQWVQSVRGRLDVAEDKRTLLLGRDFNLLWRRHSADSGWSEWRSGLEEVSEQINLLQSSVLALSNDVTNLSETVKDLTGETDQTDRVYTRDLGNYQTFEEILAVLDTLHGTSFEDNKVGRFVIALQGRPFYVNNLPLYILGDHYMQVLDGAVALPENGIPTPASEYNILVRSHKEDAWGEWRKYASDSILTIH